MATYDDTLFADADDRRVLEQMLDIQRDEILALLDRVDEVEARQRLVPSLTTVLGLVKHAVFVEGVWFAHRIAGRSRTEVGLAETIDVSFTLADHDTKESVREQFLAACATSKQIASQHPDLAETFDWHHGPISLRFVYLHLIQEYARHCGHGDILVEQILAQRP